MFTSKMSSTIETQRLISVSLGKIAQSRGQRGGINLHKNLLVATVLHKARTAYMMENFNYQQTLQRQKAVQEQMQQQQQAVVANSVPCVSSPVSAQPTSVCNVTAASPPTIANVGQPSVTPPNCDASSESRSDVTPTESMVVEDETTTKHCEVNQNKENSPPSLELRLSVPENCELKQSNGASAEDHVASATQLSESAQLASSPCENSLPNQQALTNTASTTCSVLKRRRDNPSACSQDNECPDSKRARFSHDSSFTPITHHNSFTCYSTDVSDVSSDESDSESESDQDFELMHTSDSPQISNLVSIFNSGFSGLCAVSSNSEHDIESSQHNDSNTSTSTPPQYTTLSKLRPDSPSTLSRRVSEPSMMCSSEIGRLDSLPSAIILSA